MRWISDKEIITDKLIKVLNIMKFKEFFKFLGFKLVKELEAIIGKKFGIAESDF